jgi:hypothetical protein
MEMLMLLELCKSCCAGTGQPKGAGLGAEGMEEPEAPRVGD